MKTDEVINKLLYVPFNKDYRVEDVVESNLSEDVFFEKCFVHPNTGYWDNNDQFNAYEIDDFEMDIDQAEFLNRLDNQRIEEEALNNWIQTQQNDIYCVKGDAGTGKSTYLHYLKYHYNHIKWDIIDIQHAIEDVNYLGRVIHMDNFYSLYIKTFSAMIRRINIILFPKDEAGVVKKDISMSILASIRANYSRYFGEQFPREEVERFFDCIPQRPESVSKREYIRVCAHNIQTLLVGILNNNTDVEAFKIMLEIYIYFIFCLCEGQRYIIAFDNFERFIRTDEVYNEQLTSFVVELRESQNSIAVNNSFLMRSCQIMIFMRNTSLRMFTPQQTAELFPHAVDLSGWFETNSILIKKLNWYNEANIDVAGMKHLISILADNGETDGRLRGLHFKISMLFNYNKRVIVRFLARVLLKTMNMPFIDKYDYFWNKCDDLPRGLSKFAARSIIYRLVLNELRDDEFFKYIIVQREENDRASLGYARKILSVLYEHKITEQDPYMEFGEMIRVIYTHSNDPLTDFFDNNNAVWRSKLAKVLFYMNYYDGRRDNWLQFIDIQYNISEHSVCISEKTELNNIIESDWQHIKIKITTAGMAFLYFVVYHFEYFSCKSIKSKKRREMIGNKDIPPLLCTIPTYADIIKKNTDDLLCVKVMKVTSYEALRCISVMNEDAATNIDFRKENRARFISHQQRIVNYHSGYLNNFIDCLMKIYNDKVQQDQHFGEQFYSLISKILSIKDKYRVDYIEID